MLIFELLLHWNTDIALLWTNDDIYFKLFKAALCSLSVKVWVSILMDNVGDALTTQEETDALRYRGRA